MLATDPDPRCDLLQPLPHTEDLKYAHIRQRRQSMPIQAAEGDLIEIDNPDLLHTTAR